jgi:hypothetical protein
MDNDRESQRGLDALLQATGARCLWERKDKNGNCAMYTANGRTVLFVTYEQNARERGWELFVQIGPALDAGVCWLNDGILPGTVPGKAVKTRAKNHRRSDDVSAEQDKDPRPRDRWGAFVAGGRAEQETQDKDKDPRPRDRWGRLVGGAS